MKDWSILGYTDNICSDIHHTVPCFACMSGRGQAVMVECQSNV